MFKLETKGEIRRSMEQAQIREVRFPSWEGQKNGEGEAREIELVMFGSKCIVISATKYGTIEVVER